jgi:alpha-glucosidase (family GH31 glycosyl hydrolase)
MARQMNLQLRTHQDQSYCWLRLLAASLLLSSFSCSQANRRSTPEVPTAPSPAEVRTQATPEPRFATRPPLTPRWVYEPWVWEDERNTADATLDVVDSYRRRDIPVGAVIIDSPWQTNYNTFQFNPDYPDPAGLIRQLHDRNVKVLLWATGFVNVSSVDGPERGKASNYDEAHAAGYFVGGGKDYAWDKGRGSALDFFNPDAVEWWYRQMDRAFALGIDGWKVDSPEGNLPDQVSTAAGLKTEREYGDAYYRAFYRYVAERNPDAVTFARAIDSGTSYAPVDVNPAAWVGDQNPNWAGLREAINDVLASANAGYAVVGPDIGGYRSGERSGRLFIRWAQFGALVPLMENGGRGEHLPWTYPSEVVDHYRYYAKLHHELVPYLYSAGVEAHRTGLPIIRNPDQKLGQYELGQDLLVAPLKTEDEERDVALPAGARWHDFWSDDSVYEGGLTRRVRAPLAQIPLYIRAGAIIPLQVDDPLTGHGGPGSAGHLTLLVYPDAASDRSYYPDAERALTIHSARTDDGVTITLGPQTERYVLRIKEPRPTVSVSLERDGAADQLSPLPSFAAFDQATEGWFYDSGTHYLWVRFPTDRSGATLEYRSGP